MHASRRGALGIVQHEGSVVVSLIPAESGRQPLTFFDLTKRTVFRGSEDLDQKTWVIQADAPHSTDLARLLYPRHLRGRFPLGNALVALQSGKVVHWTRFSGEIWGRGFVLPLETGGLLLKRNGRCSYYNPPRRIRNGISMRPSGCYQLTTWHETPLLRDSFPRGTEVSACFHSHPGDALDRHDLLSPMDLKSYLGSIIDSHYFAKMPANLIYSTGSTLQGGCLSVFVPREGRFFSGYLLGRSLKDSASVAREYEEEFRRCFKTFTIEFLEEADQLRVGSIQEI